MIRVEVHAGEGGADAEAFAGELAGAIGRHAGSPAERVGKVFVFPRL